MNIKVNAIISLWFGRCAMATPSSTGQMNNMKPKSTANHRWQRVVFKISGAALAGTAPNNIDSKVLCDTSRTLINKHIYSCI